jgi:hypothetical protein
MPDRSERPVYQGSDDFFNAKPHVRSKRCCSVYLELPAKGVADDPESFYIAEVVFMKQIQVE